MGLTITHGTHLIRAKAGQEVPIEKHATLCILLLITAWSITLLYFSHEFFLAYSVAGQFRRKCVSALLAEVSLSFQEFVLALGLLTGLLCSSGSRRRRSRPSYELVGQSAPSIDILVTCCGEDPDVIVDTLRAAAAQNYPREILRVLVLDDGRDPELCRRVRLLEGWARVNDFAEVKYLSREKAKKGTKSFFKAGNLNYGISAGAGEKKSEYFAALDCDMIPEPDWLRNSVGHLILDQRVGMTVTPQAYYNVPPGDPLGQQADFSIYFSVQEPLNDSLNACMCTGTGYVARRRAIEDIGGWPLVECGEDYMCSAVLSNAGWSIAYVSDNLQHGLCPESMHALLKQRMRWTDAGIEVHKQFRFYLLKTDLTATMTVPQRAVNLLYAARDYAPVFNVVALIALPWLLLPSASTTHTEIQMLQLPQTSRRNLEYLLPAAWLSNKFTYFIIYHHLGLSRFWNFESNAVWAAPYMAYRCLLSFLPSSLNPPSFAVCGSFPASERSRNSRPSYAARLLDRNTLLWIAYMIYATMPIFTSFLPLLQGDERGANVATLLPGPALKLLNSVMKMAVPVRYMLFPPTMPKREEMLEVDEKGVKRVKKEWRGEGQGGGEWRMWAVVTGVELVALSVAWRRD